MSQPPPQPPRGIRGNKPCLQRLALQQQDPQDQTKHICNIFTATRELSNAGRTRKHWGVGRKENIIFHMPETHLVPILFCPFCFLITTGTTHVLIPDETFIRRRNFALNKLERCMIGSSFKIRVACISVSMIKNSPQLLARVYSSSMLLTSVITVP